MRQKVIQIRGARQNNLKNLNLDIAIHRMTVITGVSGSGKSSLAFDTLYAEGQRRYVETFSPYARQFMDRMDRPQAEAILGVPPAIAIDRKDPVRTSRSSVGTMTELTDYVKLLVARHGVLHCSRCGRPVQPETPDYIWRQLAKPARAVITFPYSIEPDGNTKRSGANALRDLLRLGFDRLWRHGQVLEIQTDAMETDPGDLDVVADRLVLSDGERQRAIDSLEMAMRMGGGTVDIWMDNGEHRRFSDRLHCARCNIDYAPALPNLFSFNSPLGACETCRGFGRVIDIDPDLIVPDPARSLDQGAIKPWGGKAEGRVEYRELTDFCRRSHIPLNKPFADLKPDEQAAIMDGTEDYYGVRGFFRWLETKTYKMHVRVFLSRYRSYDICRACNGTRFKPESLQYRVNGKHIGEIYALNVDQALAFFESVAGQEPNDAVALVLDEILNRLKYLRDVGLGYLTLDRQSRTLSGGEVQRVALASALGASLVNALYVLDEPSIGLHPRDNQRLIGILHRLRDLPNTIVVVEHDPAIIRSADYLVDMGPAAGEHGGQVMYNGPVATSGKSVTGQYLSGLRRIALPLKRRTPTRNDWLTIRGAAEHNLKHLDVRIPLNLFVCLTGVSGSGKSTLAEEILYKGVKRLHGNGDGKPGRFGDILGADTIRAVELVDQRPIGRTPRANVLTYTKAFDPIRKLMAATDHARALGFGPGHFSFNVDAGRCKTCKGEGFEKVEMQFLSDVLITCPDCQGKRFTPEVLSVTWQGLNLDRILSLTVNQAMDFFGQQPKIIAALTPVRDVGLGYIRLGQPVSTFSGGEAQRLKLSGYLGAKTGKRLLIFDEPTTGLHFEDIAILLNAFQGLVDAGNTLLVIEHNLDVIKCADWVIDLGPEGGDAGGYLVAQGPPETVASVEASHTGQYLQLSLADTGPPALNPIDEGAGDHGSPEHAIVVRGAREHNLKNINLAIPHNQLVVLTGVSGSGKSTLAFDILFGEGQRRYLETLAPYVRQYMKIMERPDVDLVSGLSPTVAIEQRISHSSRRSTVATLTEIYHFLRLLFSKLGRPHCPGCHRPLTQHDPETIQDQIRHRWGGRRALLLAPKISGRKGFHKTLLARALKQGYSRARIDGIIQPIEAGMALSRYHEHTIDLVTGALPKDPAAISDLFSRTLAEGNGSVILYDLKTGAEEIFSPLGRCPTCGLGAVEAGDPRFFSFNSPQGACSACDGLGIVGGDENDTSMRAAVCPQCRGSRLTSAALAVKIGGHSIWDLVRQPAADVPALLSALEFSAPERPLADPILAELKVRLGLMNRLGLGYLSLSRAGNTLSGGEAQRVRLAAQLGSNLTGVTYILDEPTIGLHARDNHLLVGALTELRDRGNSVIVVEHDEETILSADTVIDLGPGAGRNGGRSGGHWRAGSASAGALVPDRGSDSRPGSGNHLAFEALAAEGCC